MKTARTFKSDKFPQLSHDNREMKNVKRKKADPDHKPALS